MPRFNEEELKTAILKSFSVAETLRNLKMCETGGNYRTIKKYISFWKINIEHFSNPSERAIKYLNTPAKPLKKILTKNSSYNKTHLKNRLYKEGLKKPICEMCGQDENWFGRKIALISDHKNGVRDDNRIENLRILCPNCNASLDTHRGKQERNKCPDCEQPKPLKRKYCSLECYRNYPTRGLRPETRKAERLPLKVLLEDINKAGYLATARKYGVSDTAIRKWIRVYDKYGQ